MEIVEYVEENNEEEVAEDWCFHCKDGGLLLVCDHKDCHKAYHSECVGKDPSFPETGEPWICNWHRCFKCGGVPEFRCIGCPKAVCKRCVKGVEFVNFRAKKSFCGYCLKLLLLIEENVEVDSDGGKIDFKDRETYEGLFKEYWDLIKDEEGVALEDLYSADRLLHKGKGSKKEGYKGNKKEGYKKKFDSDELFKAGQDDELLSDFEDNPEDQPTLAMVPSNGILHPALKSMKRKTKKKRVFIGWGSKSLIEFLISIGKDPSQTLSIFDLVKIVNEYITSNKLTDREKKKRVICDERLVSVLGKRTVNRTKIRGLLEPHLRDNQDSSEDELSDNSEEGEGTSKSCKRKRRTGLGKTNGTISIELAPRSCFASIITQNIKLVYLKRSLIQNLLKKLDTFDGKVVGSFVRVKSDPNDFLLKNSHQLLQVTGIQKASETGESNTGINLQLSNMSDGVQIRMLSDDDFTEEECEDLRQRVKDGRVKRPTIWDLEGKARLLHEDITYHWIERELALLQSLIDRANEKGWRRELCEYLERRTLLQSPSERERLIQEVPLVIADENEVEPLAVLPGDENEVEPLAVLPGDENPKTDDSPRSILSRDSESLDDVARKETSSGPKDGKIIPAGPGSKRNSITYAVVQSDVNEVQDGGNTAAGVSANLRDGLSKSVVAKLNFMGNEDRNGEIGNGRVAEKVEAAASVSVNYNKMEVDVKEEKNQSHSNDIEEQQAAMEDDKQRNNETNTLVVNKGQDKMAKKEKAVVIDLDKGVEDARGNLIRDNPERSLWHYLDPSGKVQGPFSMSLFKVWKSKHFFTPEFKVWKTGQTKEAAILLTDALSQVFPENSR